MKLPSALLLGTALLAAPGLLPGMAPRATAGTRAAATPGPFQHVLLLSIDGMHAVDLSFWYHYAHFGVGTDPLRSLSLAGTTFMNAFTSAPSDSFPGMIAQVTGATPKSSGVYYDDSYDRLLYAPGDGNCNGPQGTEVDYSENADIDKTKLATRLDPTKLPRQIVAGVCGPVYPHQFLRVNTVFEEIHRQVPNARTAWADKHPSYDILNGPSGTGVDDLYTPEINAIDTLDAGANGTDFTQSYKSAQTYDQLKVNAVINEINGFDSSGNTKVGVPVLFGMNFQSVSVGQKLASSGPVDQPGLIGGYASSSPTGAKNGKCKLPGFWNNALATLQFGCPNAPATLGQINFVDLKIGDMVTALTHANLLNSTLIIISAKHGQAPIDKTLVKQVDPAAYHSFITPALGIYDDVGLIWLNPNTRTAQTYKTAQTSLTGHGPALQIQTLLASTQLNSNFNNPFLDSRTPDFITLPSPGVIYTTGTKIAEHGGFSDDDRNVALLLSAPSLAATTNAEPVETRQIAPTILSALGLDYTHLQGVQQEGTQPLPIRLH